MKNYFTEAENNWVEGARMEKDRRIGIAAAGAVGGGIAGALAFSEVALAHTAQPSTDCYSDAPGHPELTVNFEGMTGHGISDVQVEINGDFNNLGDPDEPGFPDPAHFDLAPGQYSATAFWDVNGNNHVGFENYNFKVESCVPETTTTTTIPETTTTTTTSTTTTTTVPETSTTTTTVPETSSTTTVPESSTTTTTEPEQTTTTTTVPETSSTTTVPETSTTTTVPESSTTTTTEPEQTTTTTTPAQPSTTTTTIPTVGTLPETGPSPYTNEMVGGGLALVAAGITAVVASRRRHA